MADWPFFTGGEYRDSVPTWSSVLGYEPGERITSYAEMTRYLEALATSDRAELRGYGTSYEGRRLQILVISDPENLARVDAIREQVRRLADPRALDADAAAGIARETPAISWVAANVHGGEHSTMEACLLLAYQLIAGEDGVSRLIRKESVVVIDPLQNPDGRDRSVGYFYSAFGLRPNPDANAAEHGHPWPSARPNHYLFDLNRDWYPLTQQESRAKVQAFLEWRPQVYADLHEMGWDSTYYFPPPAAPINKHLPGYTLQGWELYGRAIAAAFDEHGIDYYLRERFDAFYPGYGECWPSFHGAIGMTFEQATVQGLSIRCKDETVRTLRDALWQHFLAAMATCETTARHREERLQAFYDFHRDAIEEGRSGAIRAYILPAGDQSPDAAALIANLAAQGIESHPSVAGFTVHDARRFPDGDAEERTFASGSFVLPLDQPAGRLLRALFERDPELDETFLREELERKKERLPDRFYDITAWSVPLAWGLEVYTSGQETSVDGKRRPTTDDRPPSGETTDTDWWSAPSQRSTDGGRSSVVSRPSAGSYLIPYRTNTAARLLADLLREGYRVHVARQAFQFDGVTYERGTLVARVKGNAAGLHERLEQAVAEYGLAIAPTASSWTAAGISLGSEDVVRVKPPRIAALYDLPAAVNSCGWLLYTLEQRYQIPFTAIRAARLLGADLRDYDVLVFPDGWEYGRYFDDGSVKRLKEWVSAGGTLIGMRGSAAFLARPQADLTTVRAVKDIRKVRREEKPPEEEARPQEPSKAQTEKPTEEPVPPEFETDQVTGAMLRVDLSSHHFLTYGYGASACVLTTTDLLFTPSKKGWNVATYAACERLHVAGFLWDKMRPVLPGQAYLVDENVGRGHVILFAEDPNFRACWEGLTRFFLNALFFAPTLNR
jgi:Zinc carboxypeptidase